MYTKNKLKDLIYIQDNKLCNEQTIKGLFRSIVEPILENNVECVVMCRLNEKSKDHFNGILKRLEYANAKFYDFSDRPISKKFKNVLKEKIWDKTEFIYILSERFGAVFIFDYEESTIESFAQIYTLHNSKNLSDAFDIINSNSSVDLSEYQEKWHPDRRDNEVLNSSIRKIIENLNETNEEILISNLTKDKSDENTDLAAQLEFLSAKSSYIAHEMRNLLSICNLYSTIIEKQQNKVVFESEEVKKSIFNARECIKKSLKMTGNLLLDFKSLKNVDLKEHDLKLLIKTAIELTQIYANEKNIKFANEVEKTTKILADENKLLTVLINLIKNAIESMDDESENPKEIKIQADMNDDNVKVIISNTGKPISKEIQKNIFDKGFTTKPTGSGLGLIICKKTLEEQFAQLTLKKSDEISTEFEIILLKG